MDNILSKIFKKRGIKDITELDKEEMQQFEQWQAVLNKEEIGVKDIVEFCDGAMGMIEAQFGDIEIADNKMAKLTLQHSIYRTFKDLINAPATEKENLVKYLTGLLK
jgi:hypothetical protein